MKKLWIILLTSLLLLGLSIPAWAASEVYGPFRITLPNDLNPQNLSWIDQDLETSGIQIDVLVKLSDDREVVEVYGSEGSYSGQKPLLGYFEGKSIGDNDRLKYSVVYVQRVGQGIQIQVTTIGNSPKSFVGSKASEINFQNRYPVGTLFTYTLAWNDCYGNNIDLGSSSTNLSNWQEMHEVGSCNVLQINPLIGHILCDVECRSKEYPH